MQPMSAPAEARPADPVRPVKDIRRDVLGAFRGQIAPVPLPPNYRLAMSAVALGMVLLPLLYVGLILLVGFGIFEYLTEVPVPVTNLRGRAILVAWMLYLTPVAVGVFVLVFLIKPLFARSGEAGRPRMLRPDQEPLLFEFVERVCRTVGAPLPKRIYVDATANAHASLRRGVFSLVGEDDLVLTIGLPLVAGLSLQQVAGVLAHEFAHFSQRAGMRLSYLIRASNFWFARVVFQPDSMDDWMRRNSGDGLLAMLIVLLAKGCIWLTRRILFGLMWAGQAISCYMMRQMEFDADRYEARLVGATTFESTMRDIRVLDLSHQKSLADLGACWRENRLADSLPALTLANRERMSEEVRNRIRQHVEKEKTELFSTHPADEERCASARRETAEPVFRSDLPATVLFRDFDALARSVTLDFYREMLGEAVRADRLVAVEEVVTRQERSDKEGEALARYFQDAVNVLRPVVISEVPNAPSVETLLAARKEAESALPEMLKSCERYQKSFGRMLAVRQAEAMRDAGFKVQPKEFDFPGADASAIQRARDTWSLRLQTAEVELSPRERVCGARLLTALGLLHESTVAAEVDPGGDLRAQVPRLLETAALVGGLFKPLREVHALRAEIVILVGQLEANEQDPQLQTRLHELEERLMKQLTLLHRMLDRVDYPFDHADSAVTLQTYAFPAPPAGLRLFELYSLCEPLFERLYEVYFRVLGRLAFVAEKVESAVGLEPMPLPQPKEQVA